jgi:hypothetical protein
MRYTFLYIKPPAKGRPDSGKVKAKRKSNNNLDLERERDGTVVNDHDRGGYGRAQSGPPRKPPESGKLAAVAVHRCTIRQPTFV